MTDESTSVPSTMDDLSDKQEIVLMVLEICSMSLSVIGSAVIVLKILRGFRSMTPYDRIVLGMSTCDILASIQLATNEIFAPRSETQRVWALGNEATCQASAFFNSSVGWAVWYNAMLSLYFLLMVLSQVRQKEYVRKSELWMHLSGLWFPITATMGLFLGWYGVTIGGGYCKITDPDIFDIVQGIPGLLSFLLIIVDYILICAIVRKSLRSNNDSQMRLRKETTTLMILYVGSIFVVWGPWIVRDFILQNSYTSSEIYPVLVLDAITFPLQGFLNAFIYFKPAYTRFRAANPNKPIRFVLHQALFNRTAPRSNHHHRNAQHVTHGSTYGHKITDITRTDPSSTDPSASDPIAEEDLGVGITGIDFESTLLFVNAEDAPAERNDSPLEAVAEENDDSPDSNS